MSHLGSVYLHEGNASYAAHLLREALPKLSTARDVEISSYFVGLLGEALIESGQLGEGHHLIGRALALAEQLGYVRYLRLWSVVMGQRAIEEARYQDAKTHFTRAILLYKDASADQVQTLCHMSRVCLSLRENNEALDYAEQAVAVSQTVEDAGVILEARGALGVALRAVGRSSEAVAHLQAASDGLPEGDVLRALAAAQADSGDSDAAIATYQRAIRQAEASGIPLQIANGRRDLGLVYLRQNQLISAIQEWTSAVAIYEQSRANAQLARLYCDIGNARKVLGQHARAMKEYEQALVTLNSVEEYDLETRGLVLSSAANAYSDQGDVESADAFFNEAITLANRTGDTAAESTRSGNYGYFLLSVGRPRRAIASLERALRISESSGLTLQNAVQTDNLGLAHDSLAEYEAALKHHRAALEMIHRLAQPQWEASICINLANTLIALRQFDEAETLLGVALTYGQTSENHELIVRALTGKASLLLRKGQPEATQSLLDEAITLARRSDLRRWLAEALAVRSQQQSALNRPETSLAAWEEAQRLYTALHMPQANVAPAWLASPSPAPSTS